MLEAAMEMVNVDEWYSGGAAYLGDDHLTVKSFSSTGAKNRMLDIFDTDNDPVGFLEDLTVEPWFTYLFRIDLAEIWTMAELIIKEDPEIDQELHDGLAEANQALGIDIQKDLIEQIDGNVGLLFNHVGLGGSDAILFIQVSDPGRFGATLETLLTAALEAAGAQGMSFAEDQIGDVSFRRMPIPMAGEVCFGMVNDHFVVTLSRARFESVVRGGGGFIESIANKDIQAALRDKRGSVFHISVPGLRQDLSGILPMFGGGAETATGILDEFSEVYAIGRVEDDGSWQEFRIQGTSPGLWKRLAHMLVEKL
jgi:hypothetical protein